MPLAFQFCHSPSLSPKRSTEDIAIVSQRQEAATSAADAPTTTGEPTWPQRPTSLGSSAQVSTISVIDYYLVTHAEPYCDMQN